VPVLSGIVDRLGAMLDVKVMQSPQFVSALKKKGLSFSPPIVVRGLIDTEASISAIDRQLVSVLGLQPRGTAPIHTPSTGAAYEIRNLYDVCLVLGETQPQPLALVLPVIESEFASQGFEILNGRDVLKKCDLRYDGPNNTFSLIY
jgi:hypothetical protein